MTARPVIPPVARWPGFRLAGAVGLALTIILALAGLLAPRIVLHGWLVAFASLAGVALGCTAWVAIHALTGGRWGAVARPALLAGAAILPLVAALALPLVLADRWLYPWAVDPASAGPDVAARYLNTGAFALRSALLLGGLGVFAWVARRGVPGRLAAALALVFYGVMMSFASFDWLLSLDPRYTSSAFGMQVITGQLLAALCVVVLATVAPKGDPVWGDFGGLMLACLLGEGYLLLMTFVVHWYGNLPDQAAWYLVRTDGGWRWLVIGGTLLGAIGPGTALLFSRVRRSAPGLRITAGAILFGLVCQNLWLVAPALGHDGGWAALAAMVALVACAALALAVAGRRGPSGSTDSRSLGHGA